MRNGRDYLRALRDDRSVYLSGERVPDVTEHPAFAGAAQTVASLYDLAQNPANAMRYPVPERDGARSPIASF